MKYMLVTIDTERDCSSDWSTSNPVTYKSVEQGIPGRLQPLFNRHGVVPTYLLGADVLEQSACVDTLKRLDGTCELGTHLHGELIDRDRTVTVVPGKETTDFSCFYDEQVEFDKLKAITSLFADRFGYAPGSFRAGCFGAGPSTLRSLERLGYRADSSVVPSERDRNHQGALRFGSAPLGPYYPDSRTDIARKGNCAVIEVPVSVKPRLFRRPLWLRPQWSSVPQMRAVLEYLERRSEGPVFANMMLHSMEIIPGASPYCQTENDVSLYLRDMDEIFGEARRRGYGFIGLSRVPELVQR
ncbi:MAG: hypothetical protein GF418_11340 [Chitinivibrionales bacterium]|nr:hypothetical protein [Chitinivibrionales bacterium]MBD3396209.1 hypothetical protein [Chitinivibrionales bacterium]